VATIGAFTTNEVLKIKVDEDLWPTVANKLRETGVNIDKPWLLLHAGVSEVKREYPLENWVAAGKQLIENGYQLVLTGSKQNGS
jgi:ADP-heptose:LPS heptosyltransferase